MAKAHDEDATECCLFSIHTSCVGNQPLFFQRPSNPRGTVLEVLGSVPPRPRPRLMRVMASFGNHVFLGESYLVRVLLVRWFLLWYPPIV